MLSSRVNQLGLDLVVAELEFQTLVLERGDVCPGKALCVAERREQSLLADLRYLIARIFQVHGSVGSCPSECDVTGISRSLTNRHRP